VLLVLLVVVLCSPWTWKVFDLASVVPFVGSTSSTEYKAPVMTDGSIGI
jgi:hypothetical protein